MTSNRVPRSICMIAYANYFTDARIKNYVDILLKNGYRVDVFALGDIEPTAAGLRVFCLMQKVWSKKLLPYVLSQISFFIISTFRVALAFFRERYDVVHVHNMPDFLVFASLLPKILGAKIILDIHDTMPEYYATKFSVPLNHPLIHLMRMEERISSIFANHVITTNVLHRETLIGHGILSGKISIVMNLANPAIFTPLPAKMDVNGIKLGYHGTVAERLGLDLILEAVWRAQPFCEYLKLVIIGDGEFMPQLRQLVIKYSLHDVVEFIGWVPVEKLPGLLAEVDLGIIGNRKYNEDYKNWMLPVKMLEYAAMGIPAIAPRLKVIRQYFDDDSAFYYEPDNAKDMAQRIIELYREPSRLVTAIKNLSKFNQQYSWANMERTYMNIIHVLINES